MKKNRKRLWGVLLTLCMVVSLMPVGVSAAGTPFVSNTDFYANGTPITIMENPTDSTKTVIKYNDGSYMKYDSTSGSTAVTTDPAEATDVSGFRIFGGTNVASEAIESTSITMNSGSVGTIYGGSTNTAGTVGIVNLTITGGQTTHLNNGVFGTSGKADIVNINISGGTIAGTFASCLEVQDSEVTTANVTITGNPTFDGVFYAGASGNTNGGKQVTNLTCQISGGTFNGNIYGGYFASGGTGKIQINGNIVIGSGTEFDLITNTTYSQVTLEVASGVTITNNGEINWPDDAVNNGAIVNNGTIDGYMVNKGTINNNSNGTIDGTYGQNVDFLTNEGTINNYGAITGTVTNNGKINNYGTIDANATIDNTGGGKLYHAVTFKVTSEDDVVQLVEEGKKAEEPTKSGYEAVWYISETTQDNTTKYDFSTETVTAPVTLYGDWKSTDNTVKSVDVNGIGGEQVTIDNKNRVIDIMLPYGSKPSPNLTFTFRLGDGAGSSVPTHTASDGSEWSLTVHAENGAQAQYTMNVYEAAAAVTFSAEDGSNVPVDQFMMDKNGRITSLPQAAMDGYKFLGWFKADGTQVKAGDTLTGEVTLYARWQKIESGSAGSEGGAGGTGGPGTGSEGSTGGPGTGDDADMLPWVILASTALMAAAGTVATRRKTW